MEFMTGTWEVTEGYPDEYSWTCRMNIGDLQGINAP